MLIFPGALPVAQPPEQVFATQPAPSPVKTVAPAAGAAKTRNETGGNTNPDTGGQRGAILPPAPNPDRPTGPPPTFEANLLEAEREKLRAGPELQPRQDPESAINKPESPYAPAPADTHKVDISI